MHMHRLAAATLALVAILAGLPAATAQGERFMTPQLLAEYIETWANTSAGRTDEAFVRDCRNAPRGLLDGATPNQPVACMTVHRSSADWVRDVTFPRLLEQSPDLTSSGLMRWRRDGRLNHEYRQIRHTPSGRTFDVRMDTRYDRNFGGIWIAITSRFAR